MTLADALKAAEEALCDKFCPAGEGEMCMCKSARFVENMVQSFERSGYVLINKTLTVTQRTAAHNALTLHKYEIQPAFDAILEKMPK